MTGKEIVEKSRSSACGHDETHCAVICDTCCETAIDAALAAEREEEREACVKVAFEHARCHDDHNWETCGHQIGMTIRARVTP